MDFQQPEGLGELHLSKKPTFLILVSFWSPFLWPLTNISIHRMSLRESMRLLNAVLNCVWCKLIAEFDCRQVIRTAGRSGSI